MSRTGTPRTSTITSLTSLLTLRTDPPDKLISKTRLDTARILAQIEIEIEIVYNMYRMRRFTPNTARAGCCLWALPTMPYRKLTSQG
jgi:hypothetical protein